MAFDNSAADKTADLFPLEHSYQGTADQRQIWNLDENFRDVGQRFQVKNFGFWELLMISKIHDLKNVVDDNFYTSIQLHLIATRTIKVLRNGVNNL